MDKTHNNLLFSKLQPKSAINSQKEVEREYCLSSKLSDERKKQMNGVVIYGQMHVLAFWL